MVMSKKVFDDLKAALEEAIAFSKGEDIGARAHIPPELDVRRIRKKMETDPARPAYLKTVRGIGYRLDAVAEWQSAVNEGCNCAVCSSSASPSNLLYAASSKRKRRSA